MDTRHFEKHVYIIVFYNYLPLMILVLQKSNLETLGISFINGYNLNRTEVFLRITMK